MTTTTAKVGFRRMIEGTRDDYKIVAEAFPGTKHVADLALGLLRQLDTDGPYLITRYEHSLQTATLAMKDGADEEMIVCALLHDIGDVVAPMNHSAVAAEVLKPYISDHNYQIVRHHGAFQMYYYAHHYDMDRNARDTFRDQPWYDDCVEFCEKWDQAAFDPDCETHGLETFLPLVESVFTRPPSFG